MKFAIRRKIDLRKYGLPYENLDLEASDADSWEEAEQAIIEEHTKIHGVLTENKQEIYDELRKKQTLTPAEQKLMEQLSKSLIKSPF